MDAAHLRVAGSGVLWIVLCVAGCAVTGCGARTPSAEDALAQGNSYYAREAYDLAIAAYSEAILRDPALVDAYVNRSIAYLQLERYDEAIADSNAAIRLDGRLAAAYYNRGVAYLDLDQLDQAVADFDEAIRLDPHDADAHHNRALAYLLMGKHASALDDFRQALNLNADPGLIFPHLPDEMRRQLEGPPSDYTLAPWPDPPQPAVTTADPPVSAP